MRPAYVALGFFNTVAWSIIAAWPDGRDWFAHAAFALIALESLSFAFRELARRP